MSKKEYIVLSEDGIHEYNIVVNEIKKETKYSLFNSNNEIWSKQFRNKLALSMIDNGNGVIFESNISKTFEYHELLAIRLLICFAHQKENGLKYRIIENINEIEI